MVVPSVADLVDAIQQHRLIDAVQLEQLPSLRAGVDDPRALAKLLLEKDWLTPFQVNYLLQGRVANLVLGAYVILQRLGEGGTGQVFKARHQRMRRIVALKVIRRELLTDAEVLARFYREIQIASQVAHPHVVHAYDAGPVGDTHFLAMEYVNGIDLSRLVKQSGPLPVTQACAFIREAALGLQHIHEHGLIHRDLKPSNLLLAQGHGSQSGSIVKILDLGLARFEQPLLGEFTGSFTPVGGLMLGTPDYMAPEQALDFHQADIRSDIYGLGCSLYYLLTGQPLFPGGTLAQKLLWHQQGKPPAVTQLRPDAPPALAPILERMLAKAPADRYQTPTEVAQQLAALDGSAVPPMVDSAAAEEAEPAPAVIPLPESALLLPAALSYPASGILTLDELPAPAAITGIALEPLVPEPDSLPLPPSAPAPPGSTALSAKPDIANDLAAWVGGPSAPPPPVASPPEGVRRPSTRRVGIMIVSLLGGLLLFAILLVARTHRPDGETAGPMETKPTDSKRVVSNLIARPIPLEERFDWQPKELVAVLGEHRLRHWGAALSVAFTPDGKDLVSFGGDNVIRFWDPASGRERRANQGQQGWTLPLTLSHDGRFAVTGSQDFSVRLWDIPAGKEKMAFTGHGNRILSVSRTPDGKTIASASQDGTIKLWDAATGKARETLARDPLSGYSGVVLSPDGKTLAYGGGNYSIRLWDVATNKDRAILQGHRMHPLVLAFSGDGLMLASGSLDRTVRVWDVATGKEIHVMQGHANAVTALAFSVRGKVLASGALDGHIKVWDAVGGMERAGQQAHLTSIAGLAVAPDNQTLASCALDGTIRLWEAASLKERVPLQGHIALVRFVAFSPDAKTLVSGSGDKVVRLWDVPSAKERSAFVSGSEQAALQGVHAAVFAPAPAQTLATANHDGTVRLWDPGTGAEQRVLFRGTGVNALALAYSPSGKWLAVALSDATIRLLDAPTGRELAVLKGHKGRISSVAFTADNQALVSGSSDGTVRVWDLPGGHERAVFQSKVDVVAALACSPNGGTVALGGGDDRFVHLWDLANQKERGPLSGHGGRVAGLAFAPTGNVLVSAGQDGRIIVWDPASKAYEWQLPGSVQSIAFAPDGQHIATANCNGTIYILRMKPAPQ
ncbi:hypothetical protein AYO44_12245 [Planctomycetaceae bacterium SCGC AG-212-F19]|nr:hypothetical protein AYO44_12245 [Planctomycetaceae bacterium SCGC AG-212-F19]